MNPESATTYFKATIRSALVDAVNGCYYIFSGFLWIAIIEYQEKNKTLSICIHPLTKLKILLS